jgi:transcriptional regulator with XRE-family HTH domain
MSFSQQMKKAMNDQNITQADLSNITGISRSGISQYLSGKNIPHPATVRQIADALNVSDEWLAAEDETNTGSIINMPIEQAAKLMGVGRQFIRVGLQDKTLPFGYAVNISGKRFSYYISPRKFSEYTGIGLQ